MAKIVAMQARGAPDTDYIDINDADDWIGVVNLKSRKGTLGGVAADDSTRVPPITARSGITAGRLIFLDR